MDWKTFWNNNPQVRADDLCRQVGRTFRGIGYSDDQLDTLVSRLRRLLAASPAESLLDLGCGNGLITSRLAPFFRHVTAVDFSRPLIDVAKKEHASPNVTYVLGDALAIGRPDAPFDRVLVSAAIQHFSPAEVRRLFDQLEQQTRPGARIVLGDVPDADQLWRFYRGLKGRLRYFWGEIRRRPVIGSWLSPTALHALAADMRWALSIHYQPPDCPNHYFRYDAVLEIPEVAAGSTSESQGRGEATVII